MAERFDAIVVGAGPNGLAAAATIAAAGRKTLLVEAKATVGGGTRSLPLTLPGFIHDACAAVHPMAVASIFFQEAPLHQYGLSWVQPEAPLAHPLPDGTAVTLERSVEATAAGLGADGPAYQRLMGPLVRQADALLADLVGPPRPPRHPFLALRFGKTALRSAMGSGRSLFATDGARALWGGLAGHGAIPFEWHASAAIALMLGLVGHVYGWPVARGGSGAIPAAIRRHFEALGGTVRTDLPVRSLRDLPPTRALLLSLTPRQLLAIDGLPLRPSYRRGLERYRYGPGVFKVDWALKEPIPWRAAGCRRAATVHVGGTLPELAVGEREVWEGKVPAAPYVLLTQPSLCDPTRAPPGKHTAWAYCRVPNGMDADMTNAIERQIERFAPGFRDVILARHTQGPPGFTAYNECYVGGDILGGANMLKQILARPVATLNPYVVNRRAGVFLGSASTPPGAGVHGLGGYYAAKALLKWLD